MKKAEIIETKMHNIFVQIEEQNAILDQLAAKYEQTGDETLKEFAALALSLRGHLEDEYAEAMEELAKAKRA